MREWWFKISKLVVSLLRYLRRRHGRADAPTIRIRDSENIEITENVDESGRQFLDAGRVSRLKVRKNVIRLSRTQKIALLIGGGSSIIVGIVFLIIRLVG